MRPWLTFLTLLIVAAMTLCAGCVSDLWSCDDGVQDGLETGGDCGGGTCQACPAGIGCILASDCLSLNCVRGTCSGPATCSDGKLDGIETDVDCGSDCPRCALGLHCRRDPDCVSLRCMAGLCTASASCSDGSLDGDETGVDCGGSCAPCPAAAGCRAAGDCASGICMNMICRATTCADGKRDGDESDVDCGGGTCPQCMLGGACSLPTDCETSACIAGRCAPMPDVCPMGYVQNQQSVCVCDPLSCDSCCDVTEGNSCGLAYLPSGNNCGIQGQTCFRCNPNSNENCEHSDIGGDYCALACNAGPCDGCCSGLQSMNLRYCLHGDEDSACGMAGQICAQCPRGKHCRQHQCM